MPSKIEKWCKGCGKKFLASASHVQNCSTECGYKVRRPRIKKFAKMRDCIICKSPIWVYPSAIKRGRKRFACKKAECKTRLRSLVSKENIRLGKVLPPWQNPKSRPKLIKRWKQLHRQGTIGWSERRRSKIEEKIENDMRCLGYVPEYLVKTKLKSWKDGRALSWCKLDYAHVALKIDFEIDGPSHRYRKEHDTLRDDILRHLGWAIVRIPVTKQTKEEAIITAASSAVEFFRRGRSVKRQMSFWPQFTT